MYSDLHFGNEPIQRGICGRVQIGFDGPNRGSVLLAEVDRGQWRGEHVVACGELHRPAKVGTAQDGKTVHPVGRDVDGCADPIGKMWVPGEPKGIRAGAHQLLE